MVNRELEFRGINRDHLIMYIEELGGTLDLKGEVYQGEQWQIEIIHEGEITFTPVFKVNTMGIRFSAENETILKELIKQFRLKTTRIGG
jgi:hypothetical protein